MFVLWQNSSADEDDCKTWFEKSKISPHENQCFEKCASHIVDMGTFTCHERCYEFCRPAKKCPPDPFWKSKLKIGRPQNWANASEKTSAWTKSEQKSVEDALNQVPDQLKIDSLNGIYRMKVSSDIINPATSDVESGTIVLYDRAFSGQHSLARILVHELAHQWFFHAPKPEANDYQNTLSWTPNSKGEEIPADDRKFVESDAKESSNDDFAINAETFLFDPDRLKKIVPKASLWFQSHFSGRFRIKEGCNNGRR